MKQYQVIARKYRPKYFRDVFGQQAIVTTLQNALKFNKASQAYLFCGLRGTGKTTLARLFAKALNCENVTEDFEPCNSCNSCKEISSGSSLDVLEIDGASNRGIDDIRNLNETIGFAATAGKSKIYIIDEVHMLTKEAFNALLKTLEEPPPHVKFFFATTEAHKVLPTIISRCQRFDLRRIPTEEIFEKLKSIADDQNIQVNEDALRTIASFGEGSLRDAESLLDQLLCSITPPVTLEAVSQNLGLYEKDLFKQIDEAFVSGNVGAAFTLAKSIFDSGKDLQQFINSLLEHYRDHLLRILESSTPSAYSKGQCLYILDTLMKRLEDKTPLGQIHIEMILLHLIESKRRIPIQEIATRLLSLEKHFSGSTPPTPAPPTPKVELPPEPVATPPKVELPPEPVATPPKAEAIPQLVVPPKPTPLSPQVEAPTQPPKAPPPQEKKPPKPAASKEEQIRQENLLRFAAVELNGSLK